MFSKLVVSFFIFVALVVSQPPPGPPPQPCCTSNQWSGTILQFNGIGFSYTETSYVYDFTNSRTYLDIQEPSGASLVLIALYSAEKLYVYNPTTNTCLEESLSPPMPQNCVPANAVLDSSHVIAEVASSNFWRYTEAGNVHIVDVRTNAGCVPVEKFTENGLNVAYLLDYIPAFNSAVFTLPTACTTGKRNTPMNHPLLPLAKKILGSY